VLPLPDWVPVDPAWADALKATHKAAALALALLVLLHVAAALKHHLIDRDGLLRRMRPFQR
jgi:cytochrome b561